MTEMKKAIVLLLTLVILLATSCGKSIQAPEQPDALRLQDDLNAAGIGVERPLYTNANGHSTEVIKRLFAVSEIDVQQVVEDDGLYLIGTATISDQAYVGSTEFSAVYQLGEEGYTLASFTPVNAVVEPVIPWDFDDPAIYEVLQGIKIRYETAEDRESPFNSISGKAYMTPETVEELEVLRMLGSGDDEYSQSHESYIIQVTFTDGLKLQGNFFIRYLPLDDKQGYDNWSVPLTMDFEEVIE